MYEPDDNDPECVLCGNQYPPGRLAAGYKICLQCGDLEAVQARSKWCVAPMHKSNYQLITNRAELIGLNNKGGIVRDRRDP